MGMFDKVKHQAQQLVGKTKEATGQVTGDDSVENAGKRDQFEGKAKETGQDMKDKAAGAAESAKDRFGGNQSQS